MDDRLDILILEWLPLVLTLSVVGLVVPCIQMGTKLSTRRRRDGDRTASERRDRERNSAPRRHQKSSHNQSNESLSDDAASFEAWAAAILLRANRMATTTAALETSGTSTRNPRPLPNRDDIQRTTSAPAPPPLVEDLMSSVFSDASESDDEQELRMENLVRRLQRIRRLVEERLSDQSMATDRTGRVVSGAALDAGGNQHTPPIPAIVVSPDTSNHHPTTRVTSAGILENCPDPKQEGELNIRAECLVCTEQVVDIVFIPCGHAVYCRWCAERACPSKYDDYTIPRWRFFCPVCRLKVESKNLLYIG